MKVAMLNTYANGGGAANSSYRLHQGLLKQGVESAFIAQINRRPDPDIVASQTRTGKLMALLNPMLDNIPIKFYRSRNRGLPFSTAYLPVKGFVKRAVARADILHLHWVEHGFVNIRYLEKVKQPIVWTLHDSWAFTGGCHLPAACENYRSACGNCPQLGSQSAFDLSRLNWRRKKRAWNKLNIQVVTPSRWLANAAKKSSLFGRLSVEVIPNGIDTTTFKPVDKRICRQIFGLPVDAQIILFGAMSATRDENKGFSLLQEALRQLKKPKRAKRRMLVVFGGERPQGLNYPGIDVRYLGTLSDEVAMTVLYSSADVMVVPSRQENLPNTIMESMACGTPVVAFAIGGIPDLIEHRQNGYLAHPYDTKDLAEGIHWATSNMARQSGKLARRKIEREYDINKISRRYMALYSKLLG